MRDRIKQVCLTLALVIPATCLAGQCANDLSSVDQGLKSQYGGDGSWWTWFACPVDMGSRLKKNAIVNADQIKSISSMRNLAYLQMARGDEAMCVQTLIPAKKLLRLN